MLEPQTNKEEEFSYVSKPSNPNILFAVPKPKVTTITTTTTASPDVDEEEEGGGCEEVVQKKVKIVEEYPPERPPERKTEDAYVRELENFIAPLLREALAPVYDTLGMIEQDSGKRQFYRFAGKDLSLEQRMTPIEWGCATVEEFFKKNKHLGDAIIGILKHYINTKEEEIKRKEKKKKRKKTRQALVKKTKENTDKTVEKFEVAIKRMDSSNNQLMNQFKQYVNKLEQSNIDLIARIKQIDKLQETLSILVQPLMQTENDIAFLKDRTEKIIIALKKLAEEIDPAASGSSNEQKEAEIYQRAGVPKYGRKRDDVDETENLEAKIGTYNLIGEPVVLTLEQKQAMKAMFPALVFDQQPRQGQGPPIFHVKNAPIWLKSQISLSVLQFMLDRQSLGALNMGAQELGYPLPDLLFSDEVNYMFAQFVSAKFAKPKSNVYASGVHGGGEVHYRISSGAIINQQQTTWLLGCRRWFKENVYYGETRETPITFKTAEEYRAEAHREAHRYMQRRNKIYVDFDDVKRRFAELLDDQRHPNEAKLIRELTLSMPYVDDRGDFVVATHGLDNNETITYEYERYERNIISVYDRYYALEADFDKVQNTIQKQLSFASLVGARMLRVKKKN